MRKQTKQESQENTEDTPNNNFFPLHITRRIQNTDIAGGEFVMKVKDAMGGKREDMER